MRAKNIAVVLITVGSLVVGLSLLGGVDLLARHFCEFPAAGGVCGLLQGITGALNHLGSIQALFIFFAPTVFMALLILVGRQFDAPAFCDRNNFVPFRSLVCALRYDEQHWLSLKTNSPNTR
jgi:hypothetical protein